jgi:ABC-2 type transport system ATP-binding protein
VPAAVAIRDLAKRYGAKAALDGLSFDVPAGAVTAILGPNGAGKTTTVEICAGLQRADAGSVEVLGDRPRPRDPAWRARIGVMPQTGGSGAAGIYPSARPVEVLRLFAAMYAEPLDVAVLLTRLDLDGAARTPWRRLSGGEQQRLSLALALVGRPELVFLDEPTAGLDPHGRRAVWALVGELRDAGVTVVLTTHAMDEAANLADDIVIVDRGRVVAAGHGSLEDAFIALTTPAVAR